MARVPRAPGDGSDVHVLSVNARYHARLCRSEDENMIQHLHKDNRIK